MTLTLPELHGLVVGEFGKGQSVVLKDLEGAIQNISTYTGITVVCRSPEGTKTLSSTGSFLTDGSDGGVTWSFTSDALLDRPGTWEGQIVLTKTGYEVKSNIFEIPVDRTLKS